MNHVIVYDEYNQPWKVTEDDELYLEAKAAVEQNPKLRVYWKLSKIVQSRGWGWWTVFRKVDEIEEDLEKLMPNPSKIRLIETNVEYTPEQLRQLLQQFGSYISTLHAMEAKVSAQNTALREGFKTGMSVAMARSDSKSTTVSGKENEILSSNELFRETKKLQITHESTLEIIKGWRQAYENAWATISRIITLEMGEVQLQTGRHN